MIASLVRQRDSEYAVRALPPTCSTCGAIVKTGEVEGDGFAMSTIAYTCHGATERHRVPDVRRFLDVGDFLRAAIPRRVFLRNWAGYTIRPPRAKGRRL